MNEQEKEELWKRSEINWKLHLGQLKIERAFLRGRGKLFVADCARQTGKSTWAAKKCIEKALKKPGARIRSGTAFLTDLEQFILPAFDYILEDIPSELAPQFRAQKMEYVFPNGSKIRLVGLDRKPNGLRGNRLDLVALHECGFISRLDYLYRSVLIPSTTHVPDAKIIMESTQPESPDHPFIQFCEKAEVEGSYIKLDVWENPLLSYEQIEELAKEVGGFESTAFRREYLCERIVERERAIVAEFNEKTHVAVHPVGPFHKFWNRLESLDSGVRDKTAGLFGFYDFERAKLCIEDEFDLQGHEVTTRRIAEIVRKKEEGLGYSNVYRRVADNDNLILIQDLGSEYNLHFVPTSKDELHAMVNKVKIWFQLGRIEIHPQCTRLIAALKAGIWNKTKSEFARSEKHGHYDIISALVYLVRNCPELENPVPIGYGVDSSEHLYVRRAPSLSDTAQTLRHVFLGQ